MIPNGLLVTLKDEFHTFKKLIEGITGHHWTSRAVILIVFSER